MEIKPVNLNVPIVLPNFQITGKELRVSLLEMNFPKKLLSTVGTNTLRLIGGQLHYDLHQTLLTHDKNELSEDKDLVISRILVAITQGFNAMLGMIYINEKLN